MSKTPLRVSLIGGGTDLPSFYENNEYGCVVSMAINRHIYIAINNRFDEKTRISYSRTELVDSVDAIENDQNVGFVGAQSVFRAELFKK